MKARDIVVYVGGAAFGFGLAYSGMSKPEVVLSFLRLRDFGLMLLMGSAVVVTFAAITAAPRIRAKPPLGDEYKPRRHAWSRNVLAGAAVFGVGWGISGLCPGSAVASLGVGNLPVALGILAMFLGAYVQGRYFSS
jgi:uncharacterized membrane protein YedE/YeeE